MRMIMMSMKMKKKRKRGKKNIRKEKETRRKMKLQVSSRTSFSPIKFDKFGKVCRFVNQRGSVLSTDTEMFGCEIVRDIPDYVNDFIKQIDFDVVIRVPISNHKGLTGSGEFGKCHRNSKMMSLSIGGNRILGYRIIIMESQKSICFIHGHSVWNTPEGKTRCVTDYNSDNKFGDTLLFVPVGMNGVDKDNEFWLDDFIIYKGDDRFCLKYNGGIVSPKQVIENQSPYVTMRTVLESKLENKGHIFSRYKWEKMTKSQMVEEIEESHFGKVSLFSKKSWGYYQNKIINTYFPTRQTQSVI